MVRVCPSVSLDFESDVSVPPFFDISIYNMLYIMYLFVSVPTTSYT